MKKYILLLVVFMQVFVMPTSTAFAEKGYYGKGKSHRSDSLDAKFFKKVKMIYFNQEELDVSEEQLDKIKKLKVALKKVLVMKDAEKEVIAIDIKSALYEDEINLGKINKLIDKKYEVKKEKAKKIVDLYAQLKGLLTEDQKEELKEMYIEKMKDHMK